VQKAFEFFEIYGVSTRTRGWWGWTSVDILWTRGEGTIFRDFCWHLLWTARYIIVSYSDVIPTVNGSTKL